MTPALVSYQNLIDTHSAKNSNYDRCKDAQQCGDTSSTPMLHWRPKATTAFPSESQRLCEIIPHRLCEVG